METVSIRPVDESSANAPRVDASGYLLKRRAFLGGWARRFFVVTYPHLRYFVSAEDHAHGVEARGVFDLSKATLGRGNGVFDIALHHEQLSKRWVLQASSKEELDRWMSALGRRSRGQTR